VLAAAGLADRFEVVVDGAVAAREGLPGKPEPDTFERAAELLGLPTTACAVVEDAESGVKAGATGEFGIVIGVDRGVGRDALRELGADVIVDELDELIPALERKRGLETPARRDPQPADATPTPGTTREEPE
jgi:beta-phosphoglucomutase-like phosphatase (HAD superfamily)